VKFDVKEPPRRFVAGFVTLSDCASVRLEPDEQLTFLSEDGAEFDVARKDWGYYATPSTNGRLARFGLRTALVLNSQGSLYVLLVRTGYEDSFQRYLDTEKLRVLAWLDSEEAVQKLVRRLQEADRPCVE